MKVQPWIVSTASILPAIMIVGCANIGERIAPAPSTSQPILEQVVLTPATLTLTLAASEQLHLSATLSNGAAAPLDGTTWESNSIDVASVSGSGVVSCNQLGSAGITARLSTLSADARVTCVGKTLTSLSFVSTPSFIRSDSPFQYQLLALYSDGSSNNVTALATLTSDPGIADVQSDGTVICNNPGQTTLSASYAGTGVSASFSCVLRGMPLSPGFTERETTFEGPFPSWLDVKTQFGAVGDGVHDDSAAFQSALNSLSTAPAVLWIPSGTYNISRELHLSGAANSTIVGQDPSTTTLVWKGGPQGTLLTLSGCMGFDVGRLTFDGSKASTVLLELTWDDVSNYYPTRNYIHDSVIKNAATGIHTGWAGETTVDRVHFDHDTVAGISLGDWNALNFNIVDSLFTDNALGVTNTYGAGAFNVSNSVFERSTSSDISIGNTGPFSFRNNLSIDSQKFVRTGMTGAPLSLLIQGNVIYNPSTDPILVGAPGSLMLIDNVFAHLGSSLHLLDGYAATPLSFFSMANTYAVPTPFGGYLGAYTSIDESVSTDMTSLPWQIPTETYVPPPSAKQVVEVAPGTQEADLQLAINSAAVTGRVLHIPGGVYHVSAGLTMPAGSDLSIVGDGPLTDLVEDEGLAAPLIRVLKGHVDIRNLQVSDTPTSQHTPLIELAIPDVPSTRVECDQCFLNGTAGGGFDIDGIDQASIEVKVAEINANPGNMAETIHGGNLHQQGAAALGRNDNYMTSLSEYTVDQGGLLLTEDGWHDVGQGQTQFVVGGSANVTEEGGTIYVPLDGLSYGTLQGYTGSFNLLGMESNSFIDTTDIGTGTLFIAGSIQFSEDSLAEGSGGASQVEQINNWSAPGNVTPTSLPFSGLPESEIESRFALSRTHILPLKRLARAGATEITLSRIVSNGYTLHIVGDKPSLELKRVSFQLAEDDTTYRGSCLSNQLSLLGSWSLQAASDGTFYINNGNLFLTESLVTTNLGSGVALEASAESARARWVVTPAGDGTFIMLNRATGDALTGAAGDCGYAATNNNLPQQQWIISAVD